MVTKPIDLKSRFSGAVKATRQEQTILSLQEEIEQLRAAQSPELEAELETLREELRSQTGEQNIQIDKIRPNVGQPRQTISEESISAIAKTLDQDGQITPIILIPSKKDSFIIWDGERRWRGAKKLGWSTLRAVISPMPEDLHRKALLTFLHHEDLNPLDKAEAVVHEIHRQTDVPEDLIASAIRALVRRLERQKQTHAIRDLLNEKLEIQAQSIEKFALSEEQQAILKVLLDLQINPASFAANDIQMLSLQDDLKLSIREVGLKGAHALVLQKLSTTQLNLTARKATRIRVDATAEVIGELLTVSKTKELVQSLLEKHNGKLAEVASDRQVKKVFKSLDALELNSTDADQLVELRDRLVLMLERVNSRIPE
ncbi:MAG: ParB/RepB/Spo0J family partition protein [Thermosynechococcaceae cyanobacterium]